MASHMASKLHRVASKGDLELLEKCVEAMNAKSDPSEEENRLNMVKQTKHPKKQF